MGVEIEDVDNGYNELVKRVFQERRPVLEIGILDGSKAYPGGGGATVSDVGTWNEFGTDTIPPRSFIRAWFDEAEPRMRDGLSKLMQSVLMGKRTAENALELLGLKAVGEIQERISAGVPPPNAPSTVAQKGSSTPSTPLIETGALRASISHRVTEE
jgi:hypothetical protein